MNRLFSLMMTRSRRSTNPLLLLFGCGCLWAIPGQPLAAHEPGDAPAWMRAGHGGAVTAVAASPDGTCIASASEDATVKLWRATDGALIHTLTSTAWQTTALAFAPDAHTLAVGCYDGSVKLWNLTNATLIRSLDVIWTNIAIHVIYTNHPGKVGALAFSPDGQQLVSASGDWVTRVWRVADGILLTNLIRQAGGILSVAFSPDGATVALGSEDKSIVLLRTSDWGYLRTLSHASNVTAIAFSPTEPILASASLDRTIRFWRTSTWDQGRSLTNHTRGVTCLAFAVDGSRLFSGDQGGVLKVWSGSSDWSEAGSWTGHGGAVFSVSSLADNVRLVSAGQDHAVNIWQISDGQCLRTLTEHRGMITSIRHASDGSLVASASHDGTIKLWNARNGDLVRSFPGHTNHISSLAFSPDATLLASGGGCLDNRIAIWRCADGALLQSIPAHTNGVNALAFSPDTSLIASAGDRDEQIIKIWNIQQGTLVRTLSGHTNGTGLLEFTADGTLLVSAGQFNEGSLKLWNMNDGTAIIFDGHPGGVQAMAINSAGTLLASAGRKDNLVKVRQINDGTLLQTISSLTEGARSLAFSPDGSLLAAGGSDCLQFWRTTDWQPCWSLTNETWRTTSLQFSPNGSFFVLGREDGTVGRLWNPLATPVVLSLSMIAAQSDGIRSLVVHNPSRSPYMTLETSADLKNWTALTNRITSALEFEIIDATSTGAPFRFYRVNAPE